MEEDIKVLKDFLELKERHSSNDLRMSYLTIYQKAVKNLIQRNKELEQENKILKNKQTKIIADSFHEKMAKKFDDDFIKKSKVKEIVEIYDGSTREFAKLPDGTEICLSDNADVIEYLRKILED